MYINEQEVDVTTDASGDATEYTDVVNGRLLEIQYVKTDFANDSTFTITTERTGRTLWSESSVNASAARCPRQPTQDYLGAASLYAGGGEPVEDCFAVYNERIKIVIASGGPAKTGKFYIRLG